MKLHIIIVSFLLFGGLGPVLAQSSRQLVDEQIAKFEEADKEMNAAYQRLLDILNENGKSMLRQAQRTWLAWRDAQAEFDSHHLAGGNLRPLERYGSRTQTTEARTAKLREDYKRFKEM
jgi:uncharacterized protein YecT (DUF1311 family)